MKEYFKLGLGLYGRLILVGIMSLFVVVSFSVLSTAAFSKSIGYVAYGSVDGGESKELYTHYYDDGEDDRLTEYEDKGYTIITKGIRSDIGKTGKIAFLSVSQLICLITLAMFTYTQLWDKGVKDSNLVNFNHKKRDIFKGIKVGLIAIIPDTVFNLSLIVADRLKGASLPIVAYKFIQSRNYGFIEAVVGSAEGFGDLSTGKIAVLLSLQLIVPIVAFVSYYLGYKNISLIEKLVYKKEGKLSQ